MEELRKNGGIMVTTNSWQYSDLLAQVVRVPGGRSSGSRLATTLVGNIIDIIFFYCFFPTPSSTFLIEGVLGSKTYLA